MNPRILVVDDDPALARALAINLQAHGYQVVVAHDGRTALTEAGRSRPAMVVLDLGLPDIDGVQVLAGIRGWSSVPVIVLSARSTSAEKIAALDAGADDYVTKPFGMEELLARVRAGVRRGRPDAGVEQAAMETDDFTVDLAARRVLAAGGSAIRLTPTEWGVLEVLVQCREDGPTAAAVDRGLGPAYEGESHYLRVYLAQLRRKLESDPAHPRRLITEAGMGYRFER